MNKLATLFFVFVAIIVLIAVRFFEEKLFYDPLIHFFKTEYTQEMLPQFETRKLLLNVAFRYLINMVLSVVVLWLIFKKAEILKLSVLLYITFFVVLTAIYFYLLSTYQTGNYLTLFYVRRFLIQPLLLLILVPAFYFQKKA